MAQLKKSDYRIMQDWRDYLIRVTTSDYYKERPFKLGDAHHVPKKKKVAALVEISKVNEWLVYHWYLDVFDEVYLTVGDMSFNNEK